jgi:hypothetical protein
MYCTSTIPQLFRLSGLFNQVGELILFHVKDGHYWFRGKDGISGQWHVAAALPWHG